MTENAAAPDKEYRDAPLLLAARGTSPFVHFVFRHKTHRRLDVKYGLAAHIGDDGSVKDSQPPELGDL